MNYNECVKTLFFFVDEIYRKKHKDFLKGKKFTEDEIGQIIDVAIDNKLEYYFCTQLVKTYHNFLKFERVNNTIEEGKKCMQIEKKTLDFFSSNLDKMDVEFLAIKTFKEVPFITRDVDLLVKKEDYAKVLRLFKEKKLRKVGGKYFPYIDKLRLGAADFWKEGLINIDLYLDVPWYNFPSFSDEFLWNGAKKIDVYGVKCLVPKKEVDLLTFISSSLYTDGKITLLDIIYMNHLIRSGIDLQMLKTELKKYGWSTQFFEVLILIKRIYDSIIDDEIETELKFPINLGFLIVLRSVWGPLIAKIRKDPLSTPNLIMNIFFRPFFSRLYVTFVLKE